VSTGITRTTARMYLACDKFISGSVCIHLHLADGWRFRATGAEGAPKSADPFAGNKWAGRCTHDPKLEKESSKFPLASA
jgi:hypothetical protein